MARPVASMPSRSDATQITALQAEIKKLSHQLVCNSGQLKKSQNTSAALQAQVVYLQAEVDRLRAEVYGLQAQVQVLSTANEGLTREVALLLQRLGYGGLESPLGGFFSRSPLSSAGGSPNTSFFIDSHPLINGARNLGGGHEQHYNEVARGDVANPGI